MTTINMSRALGVAGMCIGLVELAAPDWLARQLGIPRRTGLVRVMGAREIASGIGIVARHNPTPAQWTRVIGDAIGIGLVSLAARRSRRRKVVLGALAGLFAIGVLDVVTARRL